MNKVETAVNRSIVNKDGVQRNNNKFTNERLDIDDFIDLVTVDGNAFCVSKLKGEGQYHNREEANFENSQIISIDIDNPDPDNIVSYQSMLKRKFVQKYGAFMYTTAGYTEDLPKFRVVFILDIPISDKEEYKKYVAYLISCFKSDTACKSACQMFFGSKNSNRVDKIGKILPYKNLKRMYAKHLKKKKIIEIDNKKAGANTTPANNAPSKLSKKDAIEMTEYIFKNGKVGNENWMKTISALKNHSELNDDEIKEEVGKYVELGDIDVKLKHAHKYTDVGIGTLIHFAKENGYTPKQNINTMFSHLNGCVSYSNLKNKDGIVETKVNVILKLLVDALHDLGVFKIQTGKEEVIFYKNVYNHLCEMEVHEFRRFIKEKIIDESGFPEDAKLKIFDVIFGRYNYITNLLKNINVVKEEDIKMKTLKDKAGESYLFFRNGFLRIRYDGWKLIDWSKNDKYVWDYQIKDFDFVEPDNMKSDFKRFLEYICTEYDVVNNRPMEMNTEKYKTIEAIVGYCLTNFKERGFAKLIYLTDSSDSEYSEGGTGKSLFLNLLKQCRNMKIRDAKNYNNDSRFNFDDLNSRNDLYALNDINKNFELNTLYNLVTDDFTFEKKGLSSITMDFLDTPKILITSNHPQVLKGHSDDRRIKIFELSNYFMNIKPSKEFKHTLIDDWDKEEWMRYYYFVIQCIQQYFINASSEERIPSYNMENYERKSIKAEIGIDLFEYFENNIVEDSYYSANNIEDELRNITGITYSKTSVTRALVKFAKFNFNTELVSIYEKSIGCKVHIIPRVLKQSAESCYKKSNEYNQFVYKVKLGG